MSILRGSLLIQLDESRFETSKAMRFAQKIHDKSVGLIGLAHIHLQNSVIGVAFLDFSRRETNALTFLNWLESELHQCEFDPLAVLITLDSDVGRRELSLVRPTSDEPLGMIFG